MSSTCLNVVSFVLLVLCALMVTVRGDRQGTCGDNLKWYEIEDDELLIINGTGAMTDYKLNQAAPWFKNYGMKFSKIVVEEGVTTIGNYAFQRLPVTQVTLPESLVSIREHSFSKCNKMANITIPKGVTSIGDLAFEGCLFKSIFVDDDNQNYKSIDGVLFDHEGSTLIEYACGNDRTSYAIPNTTTSIETYAFYEAKNLSNLIIPDSVTTFGDYCFDSCSGLQYVTIPDSIVNVGKSAFDSCSKLKTAFYQGTRTFGATRFVFFNCPIQTVCVPPNYPSKKFSDYDVTNDAEICKQFQSQFNHCYKGLYVDGDWVQQKLVNATEWEKQTSTCIQYICDNETGPVENVVCSKSASSASKTSSGRPVSVSSSGVSKSSSGIPEPSSRESSELHPSGCGAVDVMVSVLLMLFVAIICYTL